MQVFSGVASLAVPGGPGLRPQGAAVALGNFDGVHRGHQELIAIARAAARQRQTSAGVLTFDPHPSQYFAPGRRFPLLMPLPRRLELIAEAGADFAVVEPFDARLSSMSPEAFVDSVLVRGLGAASVVVGYDFAFGQKRAGNAATLTALGARHGFGVTVVPPVEVAGAPVSSTRIREQLAAGAIAEATAMLGRPPEITGTVVRGAGRGRGFGIPTANLDPEVPLGFATGIYAARATILSFAGRAPVSRPAAVSVGTNPTFVRDADGGAAPVTIEAYLLDYPDEDLYGARVRLAFAAYLRQERRFDSVTELRAEIDRDIARTREIIG